MAGTIALLFRCQSNHRVEEKWLSSIMSVLPFYQKEKFYECYLETDTFWGIV